MRQDKTKLNTILLINNPQEFDDESTSGKAYSNLEADLKRNYNNKNRVLILRYSLDESQTIRSLRLFQLEASDTGEKNKILRVDYGNLKFTEPTFLGLVFYFIQDVYPADHTILMTWGHGYGVGLFKDSSYVIPDANNDYSLADYKFVYQSKNTAQQNAGPAGSLAENTFRKIDLSDMLTNSELNMAIGTGYRTVVENHKIDMLVFMNCDMLRFDTVYDLSNSAKYIIGPQTPISWSGYNYNSFLKLVNNRINDLDDAETWEIFCNNFIVEFKNKYKGEKVIEADRTCIAAIKTEKIKETAIAFNNLLLDSIGRSEIMEKWLHVIATLADQNLDTSNTWCINANKPIATDNAFCLRNFDLQNVITALIAEFKNDEPIKKSCEDLSLKLQGLVIYTKPCHFKDSVKDNFKGISITLPRNLDELISHPFFKDYNTAGNNTSDNFSYDTIWAEFLSTLYKFDESTR